MTEDSHWVFCFNCNHGWKIHMEDRIGPCPKCGTMFGFKAGSNPHRPVRTGTLKDPYMLEERENEDGAEKT